jgi:hypothetical protein
MQPLSLTLVFRAKLSIMKKVLVIILLSYSITLAYGQQSETRNVGPFTGVKAAEGIDVYLKKGDKESVKVEVTGTGGSPSDVLTEVSGSYLKVHMKDGNHRNIDVKVYVTYVQLDKLSASSAGSIYSDGSIKATNMEVNASSAGTIEVTVEANALNASSSSAGDIELKGKVKTIIVEASSAGEIDAYDLEAEDVDAQASSGGTVKVNVTKNLDANASSGGGVRYRGNPDRSNTESSSGGSVKKSN